MSICHGFIWQSDPPLTFLLSSLWFMTKWVIPIWNISWVHMLERIHFSKKCYKFVFGTVQVQSVIMLLDARRQSRTMNTTLKGRLGYVIQVPKPVNLLQISWLWAIIILITSSAHYNELEQLWVNFRTYVSYLLIYLWAVVIQAVIFKTANLLP